MEINGKRYDASSGALLGTNGAPARRSGPSIDGFKRVHHVANSAPSVTKKVTRSAHSSATHVSAHKPTPSKTLMRSAVRKPEIKSPSQLKAQTRTDILARVPQTVVAPKTSHLAIDPKRLKKATQMIKSPIVSHYGPRPVNKPTNTAAPESRHSNTQQVLNDFQMSPLRQASRSSALANIPVSPVQEYTREPDIFEKAMANATSHEQKYEGKQSKRRKSGRITGFVTATMSLLLVAGIVAYFNAPALSLQMASQRAGFEAKLPGYSPAGYSFGDLSYGPGNVTVSYTSDDARKFNITQRVSGWDSQALLNNFVSNANKAYQTYERAGRTVYFFGNNTATWVDNGVWYTVNGNNALTKNQLLDLAGSI